IDLMNLGFADQWTKPNKNYGPETVEIVKKFQLHYNLVVNGIVDSITQEKIYSILNSPYQLGNSSREIQKIKIDLMNLGFAKQWTNPNENYGPETVETVKKFQKTYNLPVSGIVDEITLSKIAKAVEDYNNRKIKIYLDAGHGGTDTGAYYGGVAERDINLAVSRKIASRLRNLGYEVIMSRNSSNNSYHNNPTKDLYSRPKKAN